MMKSLVSDCRLLIGRSVEALPSSRRMWRTSKPHRLLSGKVLAECAASIRRRIAAFGAQRGVNFGALFRLLIAKDLDLARRVSRISEVRKSSKGGSARP